MFTWEHVKNYKFVTMVCLVIVVVTLIVVEYPSPQNQGIEMVQEVFEKAAFKFLSLKLIAVCCNSIWCGCTVLLIKQQKGFCYWETPQAI